MTNINTNYNAMLGRLFYNRTNQLIGKVRERLSSGLQINYGQDDPEWMVRAKAFQTRFQGFNTSIQNIQEGLGWLRARDNGMNEQLEILQRARDLALRASNEATLSPADRTKLNDEFKDILQQMQLIGEEFCAQGHDSLIEYGADKVDIVWVMDVSRSMDPYAIGLKNATVSIFNEFAELGADLRMGVMGYSHMPNIGGSSEQMQANSADFMADMDQIVNYLAAGGAPSQWERGLWGLRAAVDTASLGGSLRPDARHVFILVTNEDSDDFSYTDGGSNQSDAGIDGAGAGSGDASDLLRQQTADKLASVDAYLYNVGMVVGDMTVNGDYYFPDGDYVDIVSKLKYMGLDGNSLSLGNVGGWVRETIDAIEFELNTWEQGFQIGPDSEDWLDIEFTTVTAKSTGVAAANIATVDSAHAAIKAVDEAIAFVADAKSHVGYYENIFESILDDACSNLINNEDQYSNLMDTEMEKDLVELVKLQIVSNMQGKAITSSNDSMKLATALIGYSGIGEKNL